MGERTLAVGRAMCFLHKVQIQELEELKSVIDS